MAVLPSGEGSASRGNSSILWSTQPDTLTCHLKPSMSERPHPTPVGEQWSPRRRRSWACAPHCWWPGRAGAPLVLVTWCSGPALQAALYRLCSEHFQVNHEEQWYFRWTVHRIMKSIWGVCLYRKSVYQCKVTILWTPGGRVLCADRYTQPGIGRATLWVPAALSSTWHHTQGSSSARSQREGLSLQLAGGGPDKRVICFVLCCFIVCFGRRFRITKRTCIVSKKVWKEGNHSSVLQTHTEGHIVGFQAEENPSQGEVAETERRAVVAGTGGGTEQWAMRSAGVSVTETL